MSDAINTPAEQTEDLSELLRIRREKLNTLKEEGKNPYEITKYDVTAQNGYIRESFEQIEGQAVRIAGRMMSRRIMGKASFMDVRDGSDRMQVYVKRDDVGHRRIRGF